MTANRERRPVLAYRAGTARTFVEEMEARLAALADPRGSRATDAASAPLRHLNVGRGNFIAGLIAAWAEVGDVITFYQERIANEGFLQTAVEGRSVRWLARQAGYVPTGAISAQVPVSFQVTSAGGRRRAGLQIPKGTILQSMPSGGALPVTFQTVADLLATPGGDAIPHVQPTVVSLPMLRAGDTELRVDRRARVRSGQMLLVVGAPDDPAHAGRLWFFGAITGIDDDTTSGSRIVRWDGGVAGPLATLSSVPVVAYVLERQTELYGFSARPWDRVPANVRAVVGTRGGGVSASSDAGASWLARNRGLPDGEWQAIVANATVVVAAGQPGIWRSADAGRTWTASGLRGRPVFALARAPNGDFYAGTTNGAIYRSVDAGVTWDTPPAPPLAERRFSALRFGQHHHVPRPPTGSVRSLLVHAASASDPAAIVAGTDTGAYRSDDGVTWQAWSQGLPGWHEAAGSAQTTVFGLALDPHERRVYAATSNGLFAAPVDGGSWESIGLRPGGRRRWFRTLWHHDSTAPEVAVRLLAVAVVQDAAARTVLLAGAADGVHRSSDGGTSWTTTLGVETHAFATAITSGDTIVLAGTENGVYRSTDAGETWQQASMVALRIAVADAAAAPVRAGTVDPTWRALFRRAGIRLSQASTIDTSPATPGGVLVDAATAARYTIRPDGAGWSATLDQPSPVRALAIVDTIGFAAGPIGPVIENEWPGLGLDDRFIDLDGLKGDPVPDSWVVVTQSDVTGTTPAACSALRVLRSGEIVRSGFGSTRTITRIVPVPDPGAPALSLFDPRLSTVSFQSRSIPLFMPVVPVVTFVQGSTLLLRADCSDWKAGRTLVVTGSRCRAFIDAPLGGLLRIAPPTEAGAPAAPVLCGWADRAVSAVAVAADGTVAVSVEGAIWIARDPTLANWQPLGSPPGEVDHLLWVGDTLWAAGPTGIWSSAQSSPAWADASLPGKKLSDLAVDTRGLVLAATDDGVYALRAEGWTPEGLQGRSVQCVIVASDGRRVAALHGGSVLAFAGGEWAPLGAEGEWLLVEALAAGRAGDVIASARGGGIFRHTHGSRRWSRIDQGLVDTTAHALAIDGDGRLYAAIRGWGVAVQTASGWRQLTSGLPNSPEALVALPSGGVLAAALLGFDLLAPAGGRRLHWDRVGVGAIGASLAATLDRAFVSDALTQALTSAGISADAPATITVLEPGARWRLVDARGRSWYLRLDGNSVRVLRDESLEVVAPPASPDRPWTLRLASREGTAEIATNQIAVAFAPAGAPTLSEVATVSVVPAVTLQPGGDAVSSVTLGASLRHVYDARSVAVSGNAVMAAQGETVHQVLGSGDASQAHQRFPLHRGPLAIRPGVGPDGTAPDIAVFVTPAASTQIHPRAHVPLVRSGPAVQWRRIDSLLAAGPDEMVYTVQTDGDGTTSVCFGDGVRGARLPSGRDNVTATYAIGAGAAGNVGAGAVSLVRSGPAGAVRVTNPLPADGGTPPEPADHIRVRAPRSLLALNRVVSLTDYQSYAEGFPGIGLCRGDVIESGSSRTLALSVTATGNALPSEGLVADLQGAIVAARSGDAPFQILAYRPGPFHLHVHVTPDGSVDPGVVSTSVKDALVQRFGVRHARFRRIVTAAEVVTTVESIAGVLDAEAIALYRTPGPVMHEHVLRPRLAQWNATAERIDAEELLYLDVPEGLRIHIRSVS